MAARSTAGVTLEIEVTQELIDVSAQQTNTRCPVALSLKGVDPNRIQRPKADRNEISFGLSDHDVRYVFKTPAKVRRFIDAFDNGGKVAPFTFTLDTADAVDARPILHPGAKDVARHGRRREEIASGKRVPRTVGAWSRRGVSVA